ncbi:MAG: DUF3857 domain-containing protein, partial [Mucilaginibacter sp.]
MKRLFILLAFLFAAKTLKAQTQAFGVVDTADLKLTTCDFEKDANALILFDKAEVSFGLITSTLHRHKRVKILNESGKNEANVRIEYDNLDGVDQLSAIAAQTINLDSGKIKITKIDPKYFYHEHTDKNKDALVLSFPNVKPGSIIEYRYTLNRDMNANFPDWYFQKQIPTRYSEFRAFFSPNFKFKVLRRISKPFVKDTLLIRGHVWAMANIGSSKDEAYMRSPEDALESISLSLTEINIDGKSKKLFDTWGSTGKQIAKNRDFYKGLDQKLNDEDALVKKADSLKTDNEKISFLYTAVKTIMKWNENENWASNDGIKSAWKKKIGNSAEINAILYHLLKKTGVHAFPMLVSTRDNGLIQPDFVNLYQLNNLVTYIPVDNTKYYVLDATNKYCTYNQIPFNLLNSYGLCLDKEKDKYDIVFIEDKRPSKKVIFINADIGTTAKMKGSSQVLSYGQNSTADLELYKTLDEKKFREILTENDNNLKISNLKIENSNIDTLPLKQRFDFTYELNNSDSYILFSPNIFT